MIKNADKTCEHRYCADPACIQCERALQDGTWAETVLCEYHFAGLGENVRNGVYFRTGLMGENLFPLPASDV